MNIATSLSAILAAVTVTGCASVNPRHSLPEVEGTVEARIGKQVYWNRGSSADHAVEQKLDELLSKPLDGDSAVQIALLNNQRLQAVYEQLGIAQADLVEAGLLKNPIFDGSVRFAEAGAGKPTLDFGVAFEFLDILFVGLRKQQAQAELDATKAQVTAAVLETAADARKGLFNLQAAEQLVELQKQVSDATAASYDLAKRLRAAGNNTTLDLANERALYEEARLALSHAEATALEQREELIRLLGLWGRRTRITVAGRISDPAANDLAPTDLERRAIENSLALVEAKAKLRAARSAIGLVAPLGALAESEVGVSSERNEGEWELGPAFSVPIPIFNQGQPAIVRAQARLRQASRQYYATAVDIRSAVRQAYTRAASIQQRIEHYRKVMLPLRQSIVEETQLQYNAMQVGAFQLLQAKRDQIQTGQIYLELLREYWIARTDLQLILDGGSSSIARSERAPAVISSRVSEGH
jgi:cobalt-zinc-cadmium efflux system outer membrane protein